MPIKGMPAGDYEQRGPGWGDCPECGKERRLVDDELVEHNRFTPGPYDVTSERCPGSGMFPADDDDLADEPALD